ncbi:MAG: hypothetical protein NC301_01995 [Bacteroides sp.]|nr:hypothetical protein [Bacteroides sp.]MCM1380142.1 hypothetical protein [Bacteroides sp.]MCM1445736.1 hypothetical protein [Prevotella sp.]
MKKFSGFLVFVCCLQAGASDFLLRMPTVSTVLPGYNDRDSVEQRIAASPAAPIEGVWQMTAADGATFAIEREESSTDVAPSRLRIIMVKSPWRSIRPGTLLGHLEPTAKAGVYEARIYSGFAQRTGLNLPRPFTLKLNDDATVVTFEPFKSPLKFNLFKLLPYMYRRVVQLQRSRPEGLNGAVKIAPRGDGHPLSPVYL